MNQDPIPAGDTSQATTNPALQAHGTTPAPEAAGVTPNAKVDGPKAGPRPQEQAHPPQTTPAMQRMVRVLDTTAIDGPRVHAQMVNNRVQQFTFRPHEPLELPSAIAAKFLKHSAFRLVDKDGQIVEYKRQPKQPEELGAGEQLQLAESETIARYDELTTLALAQRAAELPGGEKFMERTDRPDRDELIAFLIKAVADKRARNIAAKPEISEDEFLPDPEVGDE